MTDSSEELKRNCLVRMFDVIESVTDSFNVSSRYGPSYPAIREDQASRSARTSFDRVVVSVLFLFDPETRIVLRLSFVLLSLSGNLCLCSSASVAILIVTIRARIFSGRSPW